MPILLSAETSDVLHEVRPTPSLEELRSSIQPAIDQLTAQVDAKQAEIDEISTKLARYTAAVRELDSQIAGEAGQDANQG